MLSDDLLILLSFLLLHRPLSCDHGNFLPIQSRSLVRDPRPLCDLVCLSFVVLFTSIRPCQKVHSGSGPLPSRPGYVYLLPIPFTCSLRTEGSEKISAKPPATHRQFRAFGDKVPELFNLTTGSTSSWYFGVFLVQVVGRCLSDQVCSRGGNGKWGG